MSFGLQNLGVIDQRGTPAIWQSDIANFPADFIAGRILIDTFQGGIYIDTATSRKQIQASQGNVSFDNGLTNVGLSSPTAKTIGLGGQLLQNTNVDLNSKIINFMGSISIFTINSDGTIKDNNIGVNFLPGEFQPLSVVTPTDCVILYNPTTSEAYKILAEKL